MFRVNQSHGASAPQTLTDLLRGCSAHRGFRSRYNRIASADALLLGLSGSLASGCRNRSTALFVPGSMTVKPRAPILDQPVVLLVEDEPLVRLTQVDVLREAGFWVLEAQDADEAFETLRRRQGVRVVLTDVNMPGSIDGFEFARLVAQGWPEVGVMVISGKAFPDDGDLPPSATFVAKPVHPDALVEHFNRLTARSATSKNDLPEPSE